MRELRTALFREVKLSRAELGDWPLVRFVLTAAGALGLESVDVGGACRLDRCRLEAAGVPDDPEAPDYMDFMEFAGRRAAGALQPADKYRKRYDEAGAKREWGEHMLRCRMEAVERYSDRHVDRGVKAGTLWDRLQGGALRLQPLPGGRRQNPFFF